MALDAAFGDFSVSFCFLQAFSFESTSIKGLLHIANAREGTVHSMHTNFIRHRRLDLIVLAI
jgi:hypothetical protein